MAPCPQCLCRMQVGGKESDPHYGLVGVVVFRGVVKIQSQREQYVGLLLYAPCKRLGGQVMRIGAACLGAARSVCAACLA